MPLSPLPTSCEAPRAVECRDCGLLQRLPELPRHSKARCLRCEAVLRRRMADPSHRTLTLGLAGAALMVPVLLTPLMDFDFRGQTRVASVFTGPAVLEQQGMAPVGLLVLGVVVLVPALRLAALLAVLLGLRLPRPPPGLATLFRFYRAVARWSMIEVFLLGTFVAYNRL
ncbi:MAG: paraquat-inducible protein A, partial [Acetobacteraceae bacterium]